MCCLRKRTKPKWERSWTGETVQKMFSFRSGSYWKRTPKTKTFGKNGSQLSNCIPSLHIHQTSRSNQKKRHDQHRFIQKGSKKLCFSMGQPLKSGICFHQYLDLKTNHLTLSVVSRPPGSDVAWKRAPQHGGSRVLRSSWCPRRSASAPRIPCFA